MNISAWTQLTACTQTHACLYTGFTQGYRIDRKPRAKRYKPHLNLRSIKYHPQHHQRKRLRSSGSKSTWWPKQLRVSTMCTHRRDSSPGAQRWTLCQQTPMEAWADCSPLKASGVFVQKGGLSGFLLLLRYDWVLALHPYNPLFRNSNTQYASLWWSKEWLGPKSWLLPSHTQVFQRRLVEEKTTIDR